jgi:hypothetical protein
MVADLPRETLWDRLSRGEPPLWLRKLEAGGTAGYDLYRISY